MTDKKKKSLIGAFVLGACALFVMVLSLVGSGSLFQKSFQFVCYFPSSLGGLYKGSPVSLHGVQIGQVISIQVINDMESLSYSVPVVIEIQKESFFADIDTTLFTQTTANQIMADYVKKGLRAQIATLSMLTGSLHVELNFIKEKDDELPINAMNLPYYHGLMQIPTIGTSMENMLESLAGIPFVDIATQTNLMITELNKTLIVFRTIAEESDIPKLMNTYTELAENINNEVKNMASIRANTNELVRNLSSTTANVNSIVSANKQEIEGLIASLNLLSKNAGDFVKELNSTMKEDSSMMLEIAQTFISIQNASNAIAQLATLLEVNPDSIIFGKR